MDNELEVTTGQAAEAKADQDLKDAINEQERHRRAKAKAAMTETILANAREETPAQESVRQVSEEATRGVQTRIEPTGTVAFGGARCVPAAMSSARYAVMSPFERTFRSADKDWATLQYFRALRAQSSEGGSDGGAAMRVVMGMDDEYRRDLGMQVDRRDFTRADMLTGDAGGTFGVFDGTVGQALPLPMANAVFAAFYKAARVRQVAMSFTATTGASLRLALQDLTPVSNWVAEGVAATPGEPTASDAIQLQLQDHITLANLSNQLLEDGDGFSVLTWLTGQVAMQMGEAEDVKMWATGLGVGSDEPAGFELADTVLTAAPANYVPTATQAADFDLPTVIDLPHLKTMKYALPEGERRTAKWMGPDSVMLALSNIVDDANRNVFLEGNSPAAIVGDEATTAIAGRVLNSDVITMPGAEGAPATDATTDRLYYGDPARMIALLEKGDIRVSISEHILHSSSKTQYRFTHRVDSQPIGIPIAARPNYVFTGGITGAGTPA